MLETDKERIGPLSDAVLHAQIRQQEAECRAACVRYTASLTLLVVLYEKARIKGLGK